MSYVVSLQNLIECHDVLQLRGPQTEEEIFQFVMLIARPSFLVLLRLRLRSAIDRLDPKAPVPAGLMARVGGRRKTCGHSV